ncbi:MAG: uracil-DNA glycosylase [Actinomycetota bacterium]|nr:uracil-DNA glycosylase [Actinomycetota bacterium]
MGKQMKQTAKDLKTVLGFFNALGVDRVPAPPSVKKRGASKKSASPRKDDKDVGGFTSGPTAPALEALKNEIGPCKKCKLAAGRTNIVFGEGNPQAALMFIGEAPGREEDLQGRPFVGDAGKLLTGFIERMGFAREDVFITNIAKCRPPGNRAPEEDEVTACIPYLKKQIEIIKPRVIMALGAVAAQNLLATKTAISALRGKKFEFNGIPLVPTFHPAFLLRNPSRKWDTLEDALPVLEILNEHEKTENLKTLIKKNKKK